MVPFLKPYPIPTLLEQRCLIVSLSLSLSYLARLPRLGVCLEQCIRCVHLIKLSTKPRIVLCKHIKIGHFTGANGSVFLLFLFFCSSVLAQRGTARAPGCVPDRLWNLARGLRPSGSSSRECISYNYFIILVFGLDCF